jgi:exodeoxyribonuclease V alpha subunit
MITRNDYNRKLYNGDIGVVFPDAEANGEMRVFFEDTTGEIRKFSPSRLPTHETVFAITIHKSQGSEFCAVLLILPGDDVPILRRELIYTGLTQPETKWKFGQRKACCARPLLNGLHARPGCATLFGTNPRTCR